ncbi:MAG: GAF domain-containing protein, partial [Aldersonia sp.]|nr:GAF domain-containing protein [Aldersonia sp.]
MSMFSAVRPGTDLPSYARDLRRMHDAVIGGSSSPLRPRALVARSWSRVLDAGLDPDGTNSRDPLPFEEVQRRRQASALSGIIDELRDVIAAVADASQLLLVVTDADGIILWRAGAANVRHRADTLGFEEGARWTESTVGTNAIGTALAEAAPVQLFSAEHFEQTQHPWYCTASPIHDPRTGELLGIVDVSGPALTLHPTITALVETAVRLAESQLWRHHEHRLERLRTTAAPLLASTDGPLLLVDEHGWVAHTSGVAARDRIAAPRGERALTVPGLGL